MQYQFIFVCTKGKCPLAIKYYEVEVMINKPNPWYTLTERKANKLKLPVF